MAQIEAKFPNGAVYIGRTPTLTEWDRHVDKIVRGDAIPARRELAMSCCVNHPDGAVMPILNRYPAAIKRISDELDLLAQGPLSGFRDAPEDATEVTVEGVAFRIPAAEEWEEFQEIEIKVGYSARQRAWLLKLTDQPGEAGALIERFPAAAGIVVSVLTKLIGADVDIVTKKD